tara:strand:+ start:281 stop:625 length:345 start_codon:yes stop_codon:yes gene_type:complete
MKNGKIRRFRPRSNRHFSNRRPNGTMNNNGVNNIDGHRNNFFRANNVSKNPHSLERVIEKYKNLAREALGSGDKILHENYLQHSDHYARILTEVNQRDKQSTATSNSDTNKVTD